MQICTFACFVLLLPPRCCWPAAGVRPRSERPRRRPHPDSDAATSGQYHDELLTYAIDNLNRLEEFDSADALQQILAAAQSAEQTGTSPSDRPDRLLAAWPEPEMLRQIVDRLNQWIRTQPPPADWKLDPMLAALPKPLADLPQVKDLGRMEFSRFDGYALQEAVWLRDVGRLGARRRLGRLGAGQEPLRLDGPQHPARSRQPESRFRSSPGKRCCSDAAPPRSGPGSSSSWPGKLGIDAAMLGIGGGEGEERARSGRRAAAGTAEGSESQHSLPGPPPAAPRPWCVAVLIEGNAYLFDPLLGLPIPAPNGVTLRRSRSTGDPARHVGPSRRRREVVAAAGCRQDPRLRREGVGPEARRGDAGGLAHLPGPADEAARIAIGRPTEDGPDAPRPRPRPNTGRPSPTWPRCGCGHGLSRRSIAASHLDRQGVQARLAAAVAVLRDAVGAAAARADAPPEGQIRRRRRRDPLLSTGPALQRRSFRPRRPIRWRSSCICAANRMPATGRG